MIQLGPALEEACNDNNGCPLKAGRRWRVNILPYAGASKCNIRNLQEGDLMEFDLEKHHRRRWSKVVNVKEFLGHCVNQ